MTRNCTACRIHRSSSHASPTHSAPAAVIHCSHCPRPMRTFSPLEKEQHSRRSSSWLNRLTLTNAKSCLKSACTSGRGTCAAFAVASVASMTARMSDHERIIACCALVWSCARPRDAGLGVLMQLASIGAMARFTLSRTSGKIFCTNASSCCLNSSAGYLASTARKPPTLPPWMDASLCAGGPPPAPRAAPKSESNTPRAPPFLAPLFAGLMFLLSRCSSVTVLHSQYDSAALSSWRRSIWLPMTPMTRSKRLVRSAWNARHCRQQRKMTMAATGRPLW
mmetsp:Transcript_5600/g.17016  ORF Transcript_5600/g.17016 Transcript_5600/m.17016 type:complete len:279 (-) Transcript_5600:412-1248(-)